MCFFSRALYTLKMARRHRQSLRQIYQSNTENLADITFEDLRTSGIKTLIFDFDGILAAHGKPEPSATGKKALDEAVTHFEQVFILSNKPTETRKNYFNQHYPKITFVSGKRKKPFPDGIETVISMTKHKPEEICLIDDRLLTGGLACLIAGIRCIYISNPAIDYRHNPVVEGFFQLLRILERGVFS